MDNNPNNDNKDFEDNKDFDEGKGFEEKGFDENKGFDSNKNYDRNKDIEDNKMIAALAYIVFFLPLIVSKDSEFGKFHANQGLILLLFGFAVSIVGSIIPFIGWFIIGPVGGLVVLVLGVLGIVNALNGVEKELPLIGRFKILK